MPKKLPKNIRRVGRRFMVDKQIDGTRYRETFRTLPAAVVWLNDLNLRAITGHKERTMGRVEIRTWIERSMRWARAEKAPSTADNYENALRKLEEFLRTTAMAVTHLDELTPAVLEEFKLHRLGSPSVRGGTLKPSTVNLDLKLIGRALKRSVRLGEIDDNPMARVKRLVVRSRPPRYLSEHEVALLLDAAPDKYRPLYALLYYTGLRIGEALHLQWKDIDWPSDCIIVRGKEGWDPKTGKTRAVPLHPELVAHLRDVPVLGEWIFAHADGRRRAYDGVDAAFRRLTRKLGIEGVSLHTLRHTFASHLVQQTGDIRAVQELLGHSDLHQTMIYAHTSSEQLHKQVAKLPTPEMSEKMSKGSERGPGSVEKFFNYSELDEWVHRDSNL